MKITDYLLVLATILAIGGGGGGTLGWIALLFYGILHPDQHAVSNYGHIPLSVLGAGLAGALIGLFTRLYIDATEPPNRLERYRALKEAKRLRG